MKEQEKQYWRATLHLVFKLLVIWFVASFLFGIIQADVLNSIQVGGVGLGFWFAQQGSIFTFLILICIYVWRMNILDRSFDVDEE